MRDNNHTWVVIMAGGLGSRFWPMSNVDSPKQFIDVMGTGRTLLQSTYDRFARLCPSDQILVITGEAYEELVREQLPDLEPWQVLGEPLRRNTAPCVAYAAAVIGQRDPEATIIVTPSDHAIFKQERFESDLQQAVETVQQHEWIVILGAQPVRPDTSYGYIQFHDRPALPKAANLHEVVTFTEKPPVEMARQFIASGEFYWNAGIFVWTLPVLRRAYEAYLPAIVDSFFGLGDADSSRVEEVYSQCEAVSIDRGIMENAENVYVLAASFGWSDVETWDTLYDVSHHDHNGNAILGGDVFTYNSHNCVVALPDEPGRTVVLEGLDGYIVAANENTLMVCRRQSEEMVFKFASDVELKRLIDQKGKH